jgi:hypothetical protein
MSKKIEVWTESCSSKQGSPPAKLAGTYEVNSFEKACELHVQAVAIMEDLPIGTVYNCIGKLHPTEEDAIKNRQ